jgi:anti-anti-sigma factor
MRQTHRDWTAHTDRAPGPSKQNGPIAAVVRDGKVVNIALRGHVDLRTLAAVRSAIDAECARRPDKLVIDLESVEFVDSSALHLFVTTHRRLVSDGGLLVLTRPCDAVWRAFTVTNLDGTLLFESAPAG